MKIDQPALVSGQPVINKNLNPIAEMPKPEPEHPAVPMLEVLVGRNYSVKEPWSECEGGDGCQQPGIPQFTLFHIKPSGSLGNELGSLADFMRSHPNYGTKSRFLGGVDGSIVWGKVLVLKQLVPVPAKALNVLKVCLAQATLEGPVHCPVSGQCRLFITLHPRIALSCTSFPLRLLGGATCGVVAPPIQPLSHYTAICLWTLFL